MNFASGTTVLRKWAALGAALRSRSAPIVSWEDARHLIEAAEAKLKIDGERLLDLLRQSEDLLGLDDPLHVDLGLHRWLSEEREEAYSDWMQWVLQQLQQPDRIFRLFRLAPPAGWEVWKHEIPEIGREYFVAEGHAGHTGRLDVVVNYPGRARLIIEVKKTGAEEADTAKGVGYQRSQEVGDLPGTHCQCVLLATSGARLTYPGNFLFRSWAEVCMELRRVVPLLREQLPLITRAMILAFVGAVEQNLLGFSHALVKRITEGQLPLFNARIVDYMAQLVGQCDQRETTR